MWANIAKPIQVNKWTTARFNAAVQAFYVAMVGDNTCDNLISYLETGIDMPKWAMPNEHFAQMQDLIRMANILPGTEPKINKQQEKILFLARF